MEHGVPLVAAIAVVVILCGVSINSVLTGSDTIEIDTATMGYDIYVVSY